MRLSPKTALPDPATPSQTFKLSQICGFWPDYATSTAAWTYWCPNDVACAINVQVTPHIVFCPDPAYTLATTWYDYGKWPSTGCGSRQICCPSGEKAMVKNYDYGATIFGQCIASSNPFTGPLSATTETSGTSIHLSVWGATTTSLSSQTVATTTDPVGGPSPTPQAPQTIINTAPAAQDGLSIGAEVGSILGAIFGAIALAIAVYYGRKQYKLRS
ncbi:hypothetical protein F5144DRAFT_351543 [Chaetomium tenue]|uniref:Uncharacterized protein n=1 Tax=Chaetomium tenue TaxID=1854479 RepID=A0ACB7NXA0_9PEZI|nr:hypothetical protein F5144DRAFT_351543 [Chaetomium globosum]